MAPDPALVRSLEAVVGPRHVITDPDVMASSVVDWTGRFRGEADVVVRPVGPSEVAGVLDACRAAGVPLVPQGGNTGLVGGATPMAGSVVVSCRRMDTAEVDEEAGVIRAGAGATLAEVRRAAEAAGWSYGVDMASRDSATVGGMIATNAGGLRVVRYGDTRAQLLGVEAVLGTGRVISHLGGLLKDNTGYHLPGLLCGSEGTLGIVTAGCLRLVAPMPERVVAVLAFGEVASAERAASRIRRSLPTIEAIEFFLADGLALVRSVTGVADPFARPHPVYLLVEVADHDDPLDAFSRALAGLDSVADAAVATDSVRRAELWHLREAHTEAIATRGVAHKLDVSLPAGRLAAFVDAVPAVVGAVAPGAHTYLFGHLGDGNVHVNVVGCAPDDEQVDDAVLSLVARAGGSISAEHGIGRAKRRWLSLNRSPEELAAFRALKAALDPGGLLNPGVLLPDAPS